jgi:hypothetical protein
MLRESLSTANTYYRKTCKHGAGANNGCFKAEPRGRGVQRYRSGRCVALAGGVTRLRCKNRWLPPKGTNDLFLEALRPLQCDLFGRLEVKLTVLALLHACGLGLSVSGAASSVSGAECVTVEHGWFTPPKRASSAAGGHGLLPMQETVPCGVSDSERSRAPATWMWPRCRED